MPPHPRAPPSSFETTPPTRPPPGRPRTWRSHWARTGTPATRRDSAMACGLPLPMQAWPRRCVRPRVMHCVYSNSTTSICPHTATSGAAVYNVGESRHGLRGLHVARQGCRRATCLAPHRRVAAPGTRIHRAGPAQRGMAKRPRVLGRRFCIFNIVELTAACLEIRYNDKEIVHVLRARRRVL